MSEVDIFIWSNEYNTTSSKENIAKPWHAELVTNAAPQAWESKRFGCSDRAYFISWKVLSLSEELSNIYILSLCCSMSDVLAVLSTTFADADAT